MAGNAQDEDEENGVVQPPPAVIVRQPGEKAPMERAPIPGGVSQKKDPTQGWERSESDVEVDGVRTRKKRGVIFVKRPGQDDVDKQLALDMALDIQAQSNRVDKIDPEFTAAMRAASLGGGPSAAETQLMQGREAAARTGMALAASARGGYSPAAFRAAQSTAAQGAMEANQQAATLRANEMATTRGQYSSFLLGERGDQTTRAMGQASLNLSREQMNKNYDVAMQQLKLAKTQAERQFWTSVASSVLKGASGAASGGAM
jgi:hypothetical protein